jgi:hypothetical protein
VAAAMKLNLLPAPLGWLGAIAAAVAATAAAAELGPSAAEWPCMPPGHLLDCGWGDSRSVVVGGGGGEVAAEATVAEVGWQHKERW